MTTDPKIPHDVARVAHRLLQLSDEGNTRMIVNVRSSSDGQRYSLGVMERVGGEGPHAVIRLVEDDSGRGTVVVDERFAGLPPCVPSVHLNGTSVEALFEQVCEAAGAVRKAMAALQEASPHARDYYPQGERAFAHAMKAHLSRVARLQSVLEELQATAEGIAEARDSAPKRA